MPSTYSAFATSWGINVGDPVPYEALVVDWALDQWAAVSGFSNLGPVVDGDGGTALNGGIWHPWNGNGATDANGGNIGDIRISAFMFNDMILGDTWSPGDASSPGFGPYDNLGGDSHIAVPVNFHWVDDPNYNYMTDPHGYDFQSVVLHELGHGLGLWHPDPAASGTDNVMTMEGDRGHALRVLSADDIAGIDAIYGPASVGKVPEPTTMLLLGSGLLGLAGYGRKKFLKK
jgi:hypothetical protein